MVILKNLALSENLAPPTPLRIQSPPQLLKSSSQSHIFSAVLIYPGEGGWGRGALSVKTILKIKFFSEPLSY